eukprot:scaffold138697_cov18-Tisochrysis_lutea.AAC.1
MPLLPRSVNHCARELCACSKQQLQGTSAEQDCTEQSTCTDAATAVHARTCKGWNSCSSWSLKEEPSWGPDFMFTNTSSGRVPGGRAEGSARSSKGAVVPHFLRTQTPAAGKCLVVEQRRLCAQQQRHGL